MDAYEIYKEKIQAEKTFHIGDMSEEEAGVLLSKIARLLEEEFPEYEFTLSVAFLDDGEPEVEVETENGWVIDRELDERINDVISALDLQYPDYRHAIVSTAYPAW